MDRLNKNHNIVIAEDDEDDYSLIAETLKKVKNTGLVHWVKDGEELLSSLDTCEASDKPQEKKPSLIILDFNTPKKDGREALEEIKTHPKRKNIPVIVLTTSQADSDIDQAYQLGANSFIQKPFKKESLGEHAPIIGHHSSIGSGLKKLNPFHCDPAMFDCQSGEINGIGLSRNSGEQGCDIPATLFTGQRDQEVAIAPVTPSIRHALELQKEVALRKQTAEKLKKSYADLILAHKERQGSMEKLKAIQNQILRSEKLADIGGVATDICHEILNSLNIISGHSQSLRIEKSNDMELCQGLDSIMEEIQRIPKIISNFLKFPRKGNMEFKKSDIKNELESVLSLVEKETRLEGIQIVRKFDSNNLSVYIDTDGIRQVFLNVINNAKFAMRGGGVLTVSTEVLTPGADGPYYQEKDSTAPCPDKIMRLKICDTGSGIRKEDIEKIFEPFFTTKPEEKGTGLGLSISYAIIEKHGGSLEVESEPGMGTTVVIDLPIWE